MSSDKDQNEDPTAGDPYLENLNTMQRDGLKKVNMAAYAVGHVYNDLCSTCWFTYLLYFLLKVANVGDSIGAFAALAGQVADGLATPVVGYLSDRFNSPIGKRTPWYIFGTLLVIPTFFCTFNECLFCKWGDCGDSYKDYPT